MINKPSKRNESVGTTNRSIAAMCGPHHCFGRGASAPDTQLLCQILQPCQNASMPEQGCAGFSPGSANRCDQVTHHPGRTSSPLRPCLSFRYTQDPTCGGSG